MLFAIVQSCVQGREIPSTFWLEKLGNQYTPTYAYRYRPKKTRRLLFNTSMHTGEKYPDFLIQIQSSFQAFAFKMRSLILAVLCVAAASAVDNFYDLDATFINGTAGSLAAWRGKVTLVVNVATL